MKRFFTLVFAFAALGAALFCGCAKEIDYFDFVSDLRSRTFIYSDDELHVKINCTQREQPFNMDGFCGNVCSLTEIFVAFAHNPQSVEVSLSNGGGEMNYQSASNEYFLTYTAEEIESDGVDVTLKYGGSSKTVKALSVADGGVLPPEKILECAREHAGERFTSLTEGKNFKGEIFIRLIYDEGCYYYVGVCDRDKNITAYLLDGGLGKVIAEKKLQA